MRQSRYAAGDRIDIPEGNIAALFFAAVDSHRKVDALRYRKGGAWHAISHRDVERTVRHLAAGLRTLGLEAGDRVAILSENRPEWLFADFACVMSGTVSVPLYPMLPADQIDHMLRDSEARAIFVSTSEQLEKVRELRPGLPAVEHVILYDGPPAEAEDVIGLGQLIGQGEVVPGEDGEEAYRRQALATDPHDVLTILYTSGTTGTPKGVMLTHNNLVSNVQSALEILPIGPEDVSLSYLPLCHIFERMAGHYAMFAAGTTICYADSIDKVAPYLLEVRPTVMTSVPRGYEKMYERAQEVAHEAGAAKERLFHWAVRVGRRYAERVLAGRSSGPWLAVEHGVADRLVYSKLRESVGGRIRFFVSGGAPLNPDLTRLFYGAGLTILQGYGLTETSPVIATNTLRDFRVGSVGKPIPNVEVAIRDDGEIVTRGPHVMKGYYRMPEETASVLEPDGWFHTGDIGELDADGFLYITDRKKELIKTSGGKYVAPQPIETRVAENRFVSQAVLVGEKHKFPALLVVPNFERLERWARSQGIEFDSREVLTRDPRVVEFLERQILDPLNDLARYERPKKVALLPAELTVKSGELTPTLKVKRRVIDERYRHVIDALYDSEP